MTQKQFEAYQEQTFDSFCKTVIRNTARKILRDKGRRQNREVSVTDMVDEDFISIMGKDFVDYNLVLALETGRPCEDRVIGNQFERLKKTAGLPDVVFHSLRHSSTTYKLKLNHGNIKATQGDTGHAQADMVTDLYAHILDEDRKLNAQRFEIAFYANPNMQRVESEAARTAAPQDGSMDIQKLFSQLQQNPEVLGQLAALLKSV